MKKINIDSTEDNKVFEGFCLQNCLYIMLKNDNISNAFLYLNTSMSLSLVNKEFIIVGESIKGLLPSLSQYLIRNYETNVDSSIVLDNNINTIEQLSKPIIVGVDPYYLKYSDSYLKNHASHTVILLGKSNDCVNVIDWYFPWNFSGTIELEDFLMARASQNNGDDIYSGNPIQNNWAYLKKIPKKDSISLLKENLSLSYRQYYLISDNKGYSVLSKIVSFLKEADVNVKKIYNQFYIISCRRRMFLKYLEVFLVENNNFHYNLLKDVVLYLYNQIQIDNIVKMLLMKCCIKLNEITIKKLENEIGKLLNIDNIIGKKINYMIGE